MVEQSRIKWVQEEMAKQGIELFAAFTASGHNMGADDNFLLMASSQMPKGPRPPGRRILAKGDLILGEISPGADGHFVQICRAHGLARPRHRPLAARSA